MKLIDLCGKTKRGAVSTVLLVVLGIAVQCGAEDGTFILTGSDSTSNTRKWLGGIQAGDGGILYLDGTYGSPSHWLTLNSDMTLGGIIPLHKGFMSFASSGITVTFTGDAPRLSLPIKYPIEDDSWNTQWDRRASWFLPKLKGTGDNVLVKDGGAKFMIDQPITDFREVYVADGGLVATNSGCSVITELPVRLAGFLGYQPNYKCSGGDYTATCASDGITVEPGAQISVNKVNANSAALTVGPLSRADYGSLLIRSTRGTASARSLGVTEKVLTSGTVPANEKGLVAPWIAAREVAESGSPVHFLEYDQTNGFIPYSSYLTSFSGSTSSDLVKISATTVLSSDASAAAVEVDSGAMLTVDATLSLGDETTPGAIAVNSQNSSVRTIAGSGSISFGDKQGLVWRGADSGVLSFEVPITGTAGVVFTSGGSADSGTESPSTEYRVARPTVSIANGVCAGVSGGVHLANGLYRFYRGSFGANDIHIEGGNRYGSASLSYWDYATGSITNHIYVRGHNSLAIEGVKAGNGWIFDAPVTLTGDAIFCPFSQFFRFNYPIDGKGDLRIYSETESLVNERHSEFRAINTYLGATEIVNKGVHWNVEDGTFGDGPVSVDATSKVLFKNCNAYSMTNDYLCLGSTFVSGGALDFLGSTDIADMMISDATALGVGADVSFDKAIIRGATISPRAEKSRLILGSESQSAAAFAAAADKSFEIVKTGSGSLVMSRPPNGSSEATGKFIIDEGTVKLNSNPLKSSACSFWIDASDDTSLIVSDGIVTEWRSKGSVPYSFVQNGSGSSFAAMTCAKTVNGLRIASTSEGKAARYTGEYPVGVRTLFVVCRVNNAVNVANIFGGAGDIGVRISTDGGGLKWANKIGRDSFGGTESKYLYINGVEGDGLTQGELHILSLRVPQSVAKNVHLQPSFPSYSQAYTDFSCDIAEAIGFDIELTDAEYAFVHNYLSEKWIGRKTLEESASDAQIIPPAMNLELTSGATLDLNGTSQTVASLSGKGKIVNTSDKIATLTVTGGFDASISVEGGVEIVHGGSAVYKVYNDGPSTNGLAYWLDASKANTLLCDDSGLVTNWISRAGSVPGFINDGTMKRTSSGTQKLTSPIYEAEDSNLGGRPSVKFTTNIDSLWSSTSARIRTIFILKYDMDGWALGGNPYAWGVAKTGKSTKGLSFQNANNANNTLLSPNSHTYSFMELDDRFRVTMAGGVLSPVEFGGGITHGSYIGTPYVISVRIDETNGFWDEEMSSFLGGYTGASGRFQSVAEVIAFDRALSDGEMESIESYLLNKWVTSPALPVDTDSLVLAGTYTIPVKSDGTVDTLKIEGPLDAFAANLFVTDAVNAKESGRLTLVTVESIVRGFTTVAADNDNFLITVDDTTYYGSWQKGMMILIR